MNYIYFFVLSLIIDFNVNSKLCLIIEFFKCFKLFQIKRFIDENFTNIFESVLTIELSNLLKYNEL